MPKITKIQNQPCITEVHKESLTEAKPIDVSNSKQFNVIIRGAWASGQCFAIRRRGFELIPPVMQYQGTPKTAAKMAMPARTCFFSPLYRQCSIRARKPPASLPIAAAQVCLFGCAFVGTGGPGGLPVSITLLFFSRFLFSSLEETPLLQNPDKIKISSRG